MMVFFFCFFGVFLFFLLNLCPLICLRYLDKCRSIYGFQWRERNLPTFSALTLQFNSQPHLIHYISFLVISVFRDQIMSRAFNLFVRWTDKLWKFKTGWTSWDSQRLDIRLSVAKRQKRICSSGKIHFWGIPVLKEAIYFSFLLI